MKISIVIAVYNEEKYIGRLLTSIEKLHSQPSSAFEVCLVNDGSTDNTEKEVKEWQEKHKDISVLYKALPSNVGRRKAREIGARLATYENILITDARCELLPETLMLLEEINYEPLIGNPIQKETGALPRMFFLLRKKLFSASFGETFKDVFIDESNFDATSKGTTIFFVNRDRFIRNQPKQESRYVNEDSGMFALLIREKKILKTAKVRCVYHQREDLLEEMIHLFHRGPRFIFHYYHPRRRYFILINISLILFLSAVLLLVRGFIWPVLGVFLAINGICAWYFSGKTKDFFIFLIFLPPLAASFFAGIVKGLFIKLFRRY